MLAMEMDPARSCMFLRLEERNTGLGTHSGVGFMEKRKGGRRNPGD